MVKRKLKEDDSILLSGKDEEAPRRSTRVTALKNQNQNLKTKKEVVATESIVSKGQKKGKVPQVQKKGSQKVNLKKAKNEGESSEEDDEDDDSEDLSMEEVEDEEESNEEEDEEEEEDDDDDDDEEEEEDSSDEDEDLKGEEHDEDDSNKSESEEDEEEDDDEGIEKDNPFEFSEMHNAVQEEEKSMPHPNLSSETNGGGEQEYENDSSDEEDIRNTIGNVPLNWYDEYPHIGYDLDGRKLIKPKKEDKLDEFLRRMEDPNFWRTVKDAQTGQNVVLSDKDVDFIKRLQAGKTPDANYDNFPPWIEWFSSEVMDTPLRNMPPSKASFLPSKIDKMKISKMVHAIKMGWMKPKPKPSTEQNFYMLWDSDDKAEEMRRIHEHIPAPKVKLPTNAESYNPPAEYLFDEKEMKDWESNEEEPWRRRYNFVPQKYKTLREVPAYDNYTKERFQRCLDLYLCPRAKKMRLTIKAEDLVPQLPNPKDLQPFPTVCSMVYKGHTHMVRSITLEPHGQFFASGSEDGTVKIWEIATGRCMKTFNFDCVVRWVEWCPNKALSLLAVAADSDVMLINPGVGDKLIIEKTDLLLAESPDQSDYNPSEKVLAACQWEPVDEEKWNKGIRILIRHFKNVNQVTWHAKGDYFSTVMHDGQNRSVIIHQLSSRRSQLPLNKSKGLIQCVLFHPIRPIFFIATQRHVRVYDLLKQEMIKKLMSGAKWISSMAIHPGGDNVIVGTYDKKVMWFDLDLSTKPYQTLRFHGNAIRSVAFHKRYPLFASASDDLNIIISHGMVYNDLLQNPLIVPVKKLRGHTKFSDFGVLSVIFHNMQPWVFSSGADKTIRLFT